MSLFEKARNEYPDLLNASVKFGAFLKYMDAIDSRLKAVEDKPRVRVQAGSQRT